MGNDKPVNVHQVDLESDDRQLTIWANTVKKFQVGSKITLKNSEEPDRLWTVKQIYDAKPLANIHTDWKVGGIA